LTPRRFTALTFRATALSLTGVLRNLIPIYPARTAGNHRRRVSYPTEVASRLDTVRLSGASSASLTAVRVSRRAGSSRSGEALEYRSDHAADRPRPVGGYHAPSRTCSRRPRGRRDPRGPRSLARGACPSPHCVPRAVAVRLELDRSFVRPAPPPSGDRDISNSAPVAGTASRTARC